MEKTTMSLKNSENMNLFLAIFFLLVLFLVFTPIAFSHGGKHAQGEFTNLQALKKATELYDQLIGKGKLDQSWENKLSQVDIFKRGTDDKYEIVVSFERTEGDPKTVYIFFDTNGQYAGSNFSGK